MLQYSRQVKSSYLIVCFVHQLTVLIGPVYEQSVKVLYFACFKVFQSKELLITFRSTYRTQNLLQQVNVAQLLQILMHQNLQISQFPIRKLFRL